MACSDARAVVWRVVADIADVAPGDWIRLKIDNCDVLLVNLNGTYYAVEDKCTHDDALLSDGGWLAEGSIVCPRHAAQFRLRDGEALCPPAYEALRTFAVRVSARDVEIEVEKTG